MCVCVRVKAVASNFSPSFFLAICRSYCCLCYRFAFIASNVIVWKLWSYATVNTAFGSSVTRKLIETTMEFVRWVYILKTARLLTFLHLQFTEFDLTRTWCAWRKRTSTASKKNGIRRNGCKKKSSGNRTIKRILNGIWRNCNIHEHEEKPKPFISRNEI